MVILSDQINRVKLEKIGYFRSITSNMKRFFRITMRIVLALAGIAILITAGFLGWLTLKEFRPAPVQRLEIAGNDSASVQGHDTLSIVTWNIGYCGLGKEMDFFYEGGTMVRPSKELAGKYFKGIGGMLERFDTVDFIMLQEVDFNSKRTYHMNGYKGFCAFLPRYASSVAINYQCSFIPVPPREPMGKVSSGIVTYSRFRPWQAWRYRYNTSFPWPTSLAMLKRCYMVQQFRLGNGKQLLIVNLHNSTFDDKGQLRLEELKELGSFLETEYRKGNYVVAGGDWNMNPRGFNPGEIISGDSVHEIQPPVTGTFIPGWQFVFDSTLPTNRDVNKPYNTGSSGTTLIDFYVVSPNVDPLTCKTIRLGFENSDHDPVYMQFKLK